MIDLNNAVKLNVKEFSEVVGVSVPTAEKIRDRILRGNIPNRYKFLKIKTDLEVKRDIEPFPIKHIREVEEKLFKLLENDPDNPMIEELRGEYERFKWSNC